MSKFINLTIDNQQISVPEGTMIVDAAKRNGIEIPIFCYHPKLKPAGMCRMCLVEIGRPVIDRATGQPVLQPDGKPQYQFGRKLETSCTTPVSEGMEVITTSDKVKEARRGMIEFILTSHPLDCPVCDKGGECPLQNETLAYGPGESRYLYDEKMHLSKHVPLGELIFLDRERCIQCGRCVRFQDDIAGDPVIGFNNRGRSFEIITNSEPGFASYFSGNTTDICPVGALTTADFRFGARPWELNAAASICTHCPVGCNLTFNVRREAASGGQVVIKRVMPRQNEAVNEIWICDKGRFAYHYTESDQRLTTPLIRKDGELQPASWDEALKLVADRFHQAGKDVMVVASGRLPNEDLYNLNRLADGVQGTSFLYTHMAGGEWTTHFGATDSLDLGQLGKGTTILVAASDLYEEAPLWYLRLKQAAERGASLIIANARPTHLEAYASQVLRYAYGQETDTIQTLLGGKESTNPDQANPIAALANADNLVILFGSDGLGLAGSQALAQACADLLKSYPAPAEKTSAEQPQIRSLIGVWPRANDQGAWELGFKPFPVGSTPTTPQALYIVAADPFGDETPEAQFLAEGKPFLVVQDLFLTETAKMADVVLPAQAFTEREGTFTSGERRVQRFYPAVPARPGPRPDYAITAEIGKRLDVDLEGRAPAAVFARISAEIPAYKNLNYRRLAETTSQWPTIGVNLERKGLYFSGTGYENKQGLGQHLTLATTPLSPVSDHGNETAKTENGLLAVPITCLYDRGPTVWTSQLLRNRGGNQIGESWVAIHPQEATRLGLSAGEVIEIEFSGSTPLTKSAVVHLDRNAPTGVILAPRSFGLAVHAPVAVTLTKK